MECRKGFGNERVFGLLACLRGKSHREPRHDQRGLELADQFGGLRELPALQAQLLAHAPAHDARLVVDRPGLVVERPGFYALIGLGELEGLAHGAVGPVGKRDRIVAFRVHRHDGGERVVRHLALGLRRNAHQVEEGFGALLRLRESARRGHRDAQEASHGPIFMHVHGFSPCCVPAARARRRGRHAGSPAGRSRTQDPTTG